MLADEESGAPSKAVNDLERTALSSSGDGREPVLDGIRGMAILLVLFHHVIIYAGIERGVFLDRALKALGASAWLGVDLFFVLSGFLITRNLYDAKSSPQYFTSFYGRRFLRLFPLYYGFLAAWVIVVPLFVTADAGTRLTGGLGWHWAYLSNIVIARFGWQEPPHLQHFWSLAIEEQFYLTWPLLVRACDRRRLMQVCVLLLATALTLRALAPFGLTPLGAHVLTITRMDSLAAGAFVALALRGRLGLAGFGAWPTIVLIACSFAAVVLFVLRRGFGEGDALVQMLGLSIFAVAFAALIALVLNAAPGSNVRCIFGARPLVLLGQYSYGLYVFHHPVALFMRDAGWQADMLPKVWGSELPGILTYALAVSIVSLCCAIASWHLWETHFLNLKRYLPYRAVSNAV